jgi:hypothetical protein
MKRLLIILLFLVLALPSYAQEWQEARMTLPMISGGVSGASCTEALATNQVTQADSNVGFNTSPSRGVGQSFTLASSLTIACYTVWLTDTADYDALGFTISVQADATGVPSNTPLTNSSVTFTEAELANSGTPTELKKCVATPFTLAAGTYWLVNMVTSGSDTNSGAFAYNSAGAYAGGSMYSTTDNGSNWTQDGALDDMRFIIWGCP